MKKGALCTETKVFQNKKKIVLRVIKLWEAIVTSKLYFFFCRLFLMEKIPAFKEASLNNAKF